MEILPVVAKWPGILAAESVLAAVIFMVVGGLAWLLRRRGPAIHVALWSLVFVRLLLPTDLGHPLGAGSLVMALFELAPVDGGSSFDQAVGLERAAAAGPVVLAGERSLMPDGQGLLPALLWLAGFVLVSGRYLRQIHSLRALVAASNEAADPRVAEMGERWRRRLGVRRRVRIVESETGMPPFTMGVLRPIIHLPAGLAGDARSVEAAVAHEMGHVARCDALWLRLQQIVQAVYFFNPLVWISGARLNESRERLCDATVMAAGGFDARDYAGGLLNVLRLDLRGAGAPTMAARKRRIGVRITDILSFDTNRRPRVVGAMALCCVLGFFLLPMGAAGAGDQPEDDKPTSRQAVGDQSKTGLDLANPVAGSRVSRGWGPGRDPFSKDKIFHKGIDLAAKTGTPVLAPADGVVGVATEDYEPMPSAGTVIVLNHAGGVQTFYSHLGSLEVAVGQEVAKGDVIATVGSTGKSTGPHVHFEVREDGERKDPALFVDDWS